MGGFSGIGPRGESLTRDGKGRAVMGSAASIAQLGERQTEDLKVPCSIHGRSTAQYNLAL